MVVWSFGRHFVVVVVVVLVVVAVIVAGLGVSVVACVVDAGDTVLGFAGRKGGRPGSVGCCGDVVGWSWFW